MQPIEGKWPRYRREVREAAAYLAPFRDSLDRDQTQALHAIQAWEGQSRSLPPEPYARRIHTAALMHKAGTLKVSA